VKRVHGRFAVLLLVLMLAALGACKRTSGTGAAPDAAPSASASPAKRLARGVFEVRDGDGDPDLRFQPLADGYRVETQRGSMAGRVHVERGKVKLLDPSGVATAKVKDKDFGYKVYDAADNVVLKAKRRGDGYVWKTAADVDLARWERGQGTVHGQEIRVEPRNGQQVVLRGGQPVGSVSASVPAGAAALLALTELSFEQRLAALLYELEETEP
jgi:hypothetical protein